MKSREACSGRGEEKSGLQIWAYEKIQKIDLWLCKPSHDQIKEKVEEKGDSVSRSREEI